MTPGLPLALTPRVPSSRPVTLQPLCLGREPKARVAIGRPKLLSKNNLIIVKFEKVLWHEHFICLSNNITRGEFYYHSNFFHPLTLPLNEFLL